MILYGRSEGLRELDQRREDTEGEASRQRAVSEQRQHMAEQEAKEAAHGNKKRREGNGGSRDG